MPLATLSSLFMNQCNALVGGRIKNADRNVDAIARLLAYPDNEARHALNSGAWHSKGAVITKWHP